MHPEGIPNKQVISLLASMCLFIIGIRYIYMDLPLEMDCAQYSIIANALLNGGDLYSEYWDIKPPFVFIIYAAAQLLVGYGPEQIFFLSSSASIGTLLGVYFAAKHGPGGIKTGLIAALIWTIISADRIIQANYPNTEVFINCLVVWAFALVVHARQQTSSTIYFIGIGFLFAAASLFKHVNAITAAVIMLYYFYISLKSNNSITAMKHIIIVALIGVISWTIVFAYFYYQKRLPEAWDSLIIFNQEYAGNISKNILSLASFETLFPLHIFKLNIILVLISISGAFYVFRRKLSDNSLLLLSYFIGSAIAISLPGKFYAHYYQLWLPPLCISTSWALGRFGQKKNWPRVEFTAGLTASILLSQQLLQIFMPTYKVPEVGPRLAYNYNLTTTIINTLAPDERFFQWGQNVELYYYARRTPPTGELRSREIHMGSRTSDRLSYTLAQLEKSPPKFVIVARGWHLKESHPIENWILRNYMIVKPKLPYDLPDIGMRFYTLKSAKDSS